MRRRGGGLATRWTVLAAAGAPGALAVDTAGRIATGRGGWSLDWEILAGERSHTPGEVASLRQRAAGAEGAAPVALETVLRASGGDVSQSVYVGLAAGTGAGALGVLEVRNGTSSPVAVTLALRPGDFWRPDGLWQVEIDGIGALANGTRVLWWPRPPAGVRLLADAAAAPGGSHEPGPAAGGWTGGLQRVRSRAGRASAQLTWPVTHGTALRVMLPLETGDGESPVPAVVPTLAQVGRGWDRHTAGGLQVAGLPDGRIEPLVAAGIRRLLALDVSPGAGDGADGRLAPATRALVAAGLAVAGHAQRAAEVISVRAARNPSAAGRLAHREAARITAPFAGAGAVAGAMAAAAGPGGGWAGEQGGDDPALRAAFLLAVRDTLVCGDDGLDILAGAAAAAGLAGSRPPIEVHGLGTPRGVLSFAVRWHDSVPALLWELAPPSTPLESWASRLVTGGGEGGDAAPGSGPLLRASALSASWSTYQAAGEALLRP